MSIKKKISIFIAYLSAFLISACLVLNNAVTSYAYPYVYYHFPTFQKQQNTYWCWAACAVMSGKDTYPSSTATQTSVVTFVKGSPVNQTATDSEIIQAANYVTNNTRSYTHNGCPMPPPFLISYFSYNKVPMMKLTIYNSSGTVDTNHLVIPYQVIRTDSNLNNNLIFYYEPYHGKKINSTFQSLINGTSPYPSYSNAGLMNRTAKYIDLFYVSNYTV